MTKVTIEVGAKIARCCAEEIEKIARQLEKIIEIAEQEDNTEWTLNDVVLELAKLQEKI